MKEDRDVQFIYLFLIISITVLTGCEPNATQEVAKRKGSRNIITTPYTGNMRFSTDKFTNIANQNVKARIMYQGYTDNITINPSGTTFDITLKNISFDGPKEVNITFYSGTTAIYKVKTLLKFNQDKETISLPSCHIRSYKWNGTETEGSCKWTITEG